MALPRALLKVLSEIKGLAVKQVKAAGYELRDNEVGEIVGVIPHSLSEVFKRAGYSDEEIAYTWIKHGEQLKQLSRVGVDGSERPLNFEDFGVDIGDLNADQIMAVLGYGGAAAGTAAAAGGLSALLSGDAGADGVIDEDAPTPLNYQNLPQLWEDIKASLSSLVGLGEQSPMLRAQGIASGISDPMIGLSSPAPEPASEPVPALEMPVTPPEITPSVPLGNIGLESLFYDPIPGTPYFPELPLDEATIMESMAGQIPAPVTSEDYYGPTAPIENPSMLRRIMGGIGGFARENPGLAVSSIAALLALAKGDNPAQSTLKRVMNTGPSYSATPFDSGLKAFAHGGVAGAPYFGPEVGTALVGEAGPEWVGEPEDAPIRGRALMTLLNIDNPMMGVPAMANGAYTLGDPDWGKEAVWNKQGQPGHNDQMAASYGQGYVHPGQMGSDIATGGIAAAGVGGSGSNTSGLPPERALANGASPQPPPQQPPQTAGMGGNNAMFNEHSETLKEILAARGQYDPSSSAQMAWARGMAPMMQQQQMINFDQLMQLNRFNENQRQFGATHDLQSEALNVNAAGAYNPYGFTDMLGDAGSLLSLYYNNRDRRYD